MFRNSVELPDQIGQKKTTPMINRLKKLFGNATPPPPPSSTAATPPHIPTEAEKRMNEWYEYKSKLMEQMLGKEHEMVMHAIIPYAVGGGLDLYYYPNGIAGTAIATKELAELPDEGSKNKTFSCYELVMFTRHPLDLKQAKDKNTSFGKAHSNINQILNVIARYSAEANLNPNETCEFPADMPKMGGKCLIFDSAGQHSDDRVKTFGLLIVIEIFRSEMLFAMEKGGGQLLAKLKEAGHYPYSDMERQPVV